MNAHISSSVSVNVILAILCERQIIVELTAGEMCVNRYIGIFWNADIDSSGTAFDI